MRTTECRGLPRDTVDVVIKSPARYISLTPDSRGSRPRARAKPGEWEKTSATHQAHPSAVAVAPSGAVYARSAALGFLCSLGFISFWDLYLYGFVSSWIRLFGDGSLSWTCASCRRWRR